MRNGSLVPGFGQGDPPHRDTIGRHRLIGGHDAEPDNIAGFADLRPGLENFGVAGLVGVVEVFGRRPARIGRGGPEGEEPSVRRQLDQIDAGAGRDRNGERAIGTAPGQRRLSVAATIGLPNARKQLALLIGQTPRGVGSRGRIDRHPDRHRPEHAVAESIAIERLPGFELDRRVGGDEPRPGEGARKRRHPAGSRPVEQVERGAIGPGCLATGSAPGRRRARHQRRLGGGDALDPLAGRIGPKPGVGLGQIVGGWTGIPPEVDSGPIRRPPGVAHAEPEPPVVAGRILDREGSPRQRNSG